jgi:UDP-2,3-diacylglucosamine pyrophosphatase LpxH
MHPRSIFVSDVHLGCRHAKTDDFLRFLHEYEQHFLYLGDVFGGWRLRKEWNWRPAYTAIVERLLEMARTGCGHVHSPALVERGDGVSYYNIGDWVENCTAIVEHADGRLHLLSSPA